MNFVSEKELKEQGGESKDEPIDYRPLYDRLKEVKDKAQAEKDELFASQSKFRGLDEDETNFFNKVYEAKDNVERERKEEEKEILKRALLIDASASTSSSITISDLKPKMEKASGKVKNQKEVLKKLVVKRKAASPENESTDVKQKKIESPEKAVEDKKEEIKVIPKKSLLQGYSSSSDDGD